MEFDVSKRKEKFFDILKLIFGVVALVVGFLGLIFPILPGWIFIFVGLELLGIHIVFIENIKKYALKKIEESKRLKNKEKKKTGENKNDSRG